MLPTPTPQRRPVRSPARRRLLHRRARRALSAALLATAAAVLTTALTPLPAPTDPVVVATRDLPAGAVLTAGDVTLAHWPRGARPPGAARQVPDAVGAVLAGALRQGEPFTDARALGPGLLAGQPAGTVIAAVTLSDPSTLTALAPGRRIDVLVREPDLVSGAPGAAERVARDVVVLALPSAAATGTGLLPAPGSADGATLLLAVDEDTARRLAGTAGSWTGVVLRG